jgi:hypothetical protein
MVGVFINELVVNARAQGSPISFKVSPISSRRTSCLIFTQPVVNPMLGPSESALINLGARFPPCMKVVEGVPTTTLFGCESHFFCVMHDFTNRECQASIILPTLPISYALWRTFVGLVASTVNHQTNGFGERSVHLALTVVLTDSQIYHAYLHPCWNNTHFTEHGWPIVALRPSTYPSFKSHIVLMALSQIEREMGSGGFILTYFAAGIFGNVLGGNFALVGSPSMGASGAIFGTLAVCCIFLIPLYPATQLVFSR